MSFVMLGRSGEHDFAQRRDTLMLAHGLVSEDYFWELGTYMIDINREIYCIIGLVSLMLYIH